jgi:NADH-quinone oxidoreductase subunit E
MTLATNPELDLSALDDVLARYPRERRSLVMVLQDAQEAYNYLPREVLIAVAEALDVPRSHVYHVATFYKAFSLEPRGKHTCTVCTGTACHVRGAGLLVEHIERRTGLSAGETTADLNLTLETVNCVGACALGPVVSVDGATIGSATTRKVDKALKPILAVLATSDGEDTK